MTPAVRAAAHHSLSDYSLFEGRTLTGRVKIKGEVIFTQGDFLPAS